jgi:hypothetical protein
MTTHELKTIEPYFSAVFDGRKTFELRRDDRGFEAGDVLVLREWTLGNEYADSQPIRRRVAFVLRDVPHLGLAPGFAILGLHGDGFGERIGSQDRPHEDAAGEVAGRVIGCVRCACPAALVGDVIPADGLCAECREPAPSVPAAPARPGEG